MHLVCAGGCRLEDADALISSTGWLVDGDVLEWLHPDAAKALLAALARGEEGAFSSAPDALMKHILAACEGLDLFTKEAERETVRRIRAIAHRPYAVLSRFG